MSNYIISTHRFLMTVDGVNIPCQEITVPEASQEVISYETGDRLDGTAPIKSPGREVFGEITAKVPSMKNDTLLHDWYQAVRTDDTQKKTVIITLLDEQQQPVMSWTVYKAWPSKISGVSLNAGTSAAKTADITLQNEGYSQQYH